MIELFTPQQIRCEHCGFEFVMTGSGSAAKIVCLACGKETVLESPVECKPEFPEIVSKSPTEALLCSVEQCPLLTENEAGSHAVRGGIAEQIKLRLRKKAEQRRNILAWTVMLQVCVLFGVVLFVAKPLLLPEESPTVDSIANIKIESETGPTPVVSPPAMQVAHRPESVEPLLAIPEVRPTLNHTPVVEPPLPIAESEYAISPFELTPSGTPHLIFPLPTFEVPVFALSGEKAGDTVPGALLATPDSLLTAPGTPLAVSSESLPAPLPPAEPVTRATADRLLESAKTTLATDPKNSAQQAVRAANIYEELGYPFPDSLYWIVGNAVASLSWGEPLLESSPAIETMALSADNRYLLAQLRDKTVWLWDLRSPEDERAGYPLDKGTAEYVKFVFSPDLRWIIGGQKNGIIRIWDMSLENPGGTLITFVDRVPDLQDLQISPNGQWLVAFGNAPQPDRFGVVESSPYSVLLWNLRQMEIGVVPMATPVPSMPQAVQVLRFSPNSDRLAIGSRDAVVRVYDLAERGVGEEPFILRGHQLGITQIIFAPCGQWLATGSQDNTVRLWNLTSPKAVPESTTLFGHIGWISALTIDQSGEYILSGSYDRTIRIWNIRQNRIATAVTAPPIVLRSNLGVPESLAITRDGDKMMVLGSEGCLGIYHLPSLLGDDPDDYFRAVTFRNSSLSISKSMLTTDDQLLIFSYEHLSNPSNNGIRLWALQAQPSVR